MIFLKLIYILYSLREVFSFTIGFSVLVWISYMFKLHRFDDDVRQIKTFSEWQRLLCVFINDWQLFMTATFDCLLLFKGQSIMKCICSTLPDVPLYVNSHFQPLIKFISSVVIYKPFRFFFFLHCDLCSVSKLCCHTCCYDQIYLV